MAPWSFPSLFTFDDPSVLKWPATVHVKPLTSWERSEIVEDMVRDWTRFNPHLCALKADANPLDIVETNAGILLKKAFPQASFDTLIQMCTTSSSHSHLDRQMAVHQIDWPSPLINPDVVRSLLALFVSYFAGDDQASNLEQVAFRQAFGAVDSLRLDVRTPTNGERVQRTQEEARALLSVLPTPMTSDNPGASRARIRL